LYASLDFGRKWQLVHEHVNRFYWSVTGLDKESDLVHMEAHTPNGRIQYVTCRALTCSEPNRNYPFPGYIDISSLVVQDDYMFIQVTTAGQASYYVSYQRDPFLKIKLPKYSLPKDLHIVSTDEHQVFAAVQEWNQNDTYNLYLSDTRGILFTLAMENVKTTRGLGGNQMLDLYEVAGIKGMLIANRRLDNQVKTYITYNKGRDWRLLQAPATDLAGNDIHCILPFCSLHLQLQTSENPYLSGSISTKASAPGIIVATGNIGSELSYNNVGMFISSDAGNNWRQIFEEEHNVWFLDKGGALVAVKQPTVPTRHLQISFDEGRQWTRHSFSLVPLFVDGMLVEAGTENQIMTFFGHFSHRSEWQLIKIDYKSIFTGNVQKETIRRGTFNNKWMTEKIKKDEKVSTITVKREITTTEHELNTDFQERLLHFRSHVFNIKWQFDAYRELRRSLKHNESLLHIDFSENYSCKYSEEIQSVHFGGSHKQASLHTGVLYTTGEQAPHTFCSISPSRRHDPVAIWAHLDPVLKVVRERHPQVSTLHFFSDGPATQYRQKGNLFYLSTEPYKYGFKEITWNLFEANHGKGAPDDGVGGALKRSADRIVAHGGDIPDAQSLYNKLKSLDTSVELFFIPERDIESKPESKHIFSLYRSTDYGSTYERMNDKVGSKTVLSYLYVCPSNKRKIMVLTDPEFESSVLISSDEGASYQKYRLSFYILSLLFHPTQEDWALAYSHDQKSIMKPITI
ncbi:hypothetical protein J4Q44_G00383610, partial [Coregonus suidteri]